MEVTKHTYLLYRGDNNIEKSQVRKRAERATKESKSDRSLIETELRNEVEVKYSIYC